MQAVQADLIERYQMQLEKEPKSRAFAPLAEAYRKLGWLKQAKEVCLEGLRHNPHFAGGHIALARILMETKEFQPAVTNLKKAVELAPENFLAYSLLAEAYLQLKDAKEALKAYKMLLFLDPNHLKAQAAVRKLESLTADEYEDEVFAMKPLKAAVSGLSETAIPIEPLPPKSNSDGRIRELERFLSLIDAYMVRNSTEQAAQLLREAESAHGSHPEIVKRLKILNQRHLDVEENTDPDAAPIPNRKDMIRQEKIAQLQSMLERVRSLRDQGD